MNKMIYDAICLAIEKYDSNTLHHAMRVAKYARENKLARVFFDGSTLDLVYCVGLLHDIVEDTDVTDQDLNLMFSSKLAVCISELTKEKDEDYMNYIKSFKDKDASVISYVVKMADMKDHLSLKETLTDKLKEKYLTALPELL